MTLKESYSYQNFINTMILNCQSLLTNRTFVMTTTEIHNVRKAEPNGEDKIVTTPCNVRIDCKPMDIVNLLVKLLDEKDKLSTAISDVKKKTEIDIDKCMSMNKLRSQIIATFNKMANMESSENEVNGTGYRLNQTSGSQERFNYTIVKKTEINFDRKDIRALIKKYTKINKELSDKKDLIEIITNVDFVPAFEIDSTLEELVESM